MKGPFNGLLGLIDDQGIQNEFLKVASQTGLTDADVELAKILMALQMYKAFYAVIPGQIRTTHEEALIEMRRIRDDAEAFSIRVSEDAQKIGRWAEAIHGALQEAEPGKVAAIVHKRLMEESVQTLSGCLRALSAACGQVEAATKKMNGVAHCAGVAIQDWQTISLRRVWATALCFSFGLTVLCVLAARTLRLWE